MLKRTNKDINLTIAKKPRQSSPSETCEKENFSAQEDSGLGPDIEDERRDKMATDFSPKKSQFTSTNSDKFQKKISPFSKKNAQLSVDTSPLPFDEETVDQPFKLLLSEVSRNNDEDSLMEVDEASAEGGHLFSPDITTPPGDKLNINSVIDIIGSYPEDNSQQSEATPLIPVSQRRESDDQSPATEVSASAETNRKSIEAEVTSMSQNVENDPEDLLAEASETNVEDAEPTVERSPSQSSEDDQGSLYVPTSELSGEDNRHYAKPRPKSSKNNQTGQTRISVSSRASSESETAHSQEYPEVPPAETSEPKKRRKKGMRFTHVKSHKESTVESKLVFDNYKPGPSSDRELILNNIYMPKNFSSRLFKNITKIGLMKKIIINYFGRDRMPKIALKEPTRKYPGELHPTLLVNDTQVQDIIDLYHHYAPLLFLSGPGLPFKKVRQLIGKLCSEIRNFY
ncbi:uncharacterized protein LOC103576077 isoform X2 [Microplitis demolitor]|uniref:uncharacterized protein LOC103576077 isoform X2 n=1 Tax=Microplitis demolitor TaxID=69319 RepID=UPI00235B6819|nr:uncharacterized protein LOC103576077 isoform X2 [Microplitis demolitor]